MNLIQSTRRIFAYSVPVDMRKGFAGLEGLVRTVLGREPLTGDVFVFVNRSGKHLKCLFWDRTGYVVLHKRIEHGKFGFLGENAQLELNEQRLGLLLDGVRVGGISSTAQNSIP